MPAESSEGSQPTRGRRRLGSVAKQAKARSKGGQVSARRQAREAKEAYAHLVGDMRSWHRLGMPLGEIAWLLNCEGHRTRTGSCWRAASVHRALKRVEREAK